ncbi:MAG TPA: hypothetical protein PK604_00625 [Acetivibrio clariflavus]|nr:hypothetical protein [Acetivibrio clariflavus]HPU41554.1 hypothetical protein [Acetivibrio clariflavus]
MKKGWIVIFLVNLINILCLISVLAGDIPESALLDADLCLIGEVQKVENSICTVKISEVLFGEYLQDTIEIEDLKYLVGIGENSNPKEGDYCAVVVQKRSENKYSVYGSLAAKADSLDKNTLKLESSNEFINRMNDYINNGWYSNRNLEEIKNKIKNSQSVATSRQSEATPDKTQNPENTDVNNSIIAEQDKNLSQKSDNYVWIVSGVILAGAVLSAAIVILNRRKGKN